jgi:hypothetical protein
MNAKQFFTQAMLASLPIAAGIIKQKQPGEDTLNLPTGDKELDYAMDVATAADQLAMQLTLEWQNTLAFFDSEDGRCDDPHHIPSNKDLSRGEDANGKN